MNLLPGLGLLLAGFLAAEGLLKARVPPKNHGAVSRAQEQPGRRAARELARRNVGFGFRLYQKLAANSPGKNIFFSPVSISTAFALLSLGAQNSTLAEIKQGFNFGKMPEKELHEGFHYLIQRLNQNTQGLQLSLEDTLFLDQRLRPVKRFMAEAKDLYDADSVPTDFRDAAGAQKQINDYVSKQTHGKITDLVRNIDPGTVMLLVNCIFFRARWLHEFDPKSTKEGDFFLEENRPVRVPMMFRGGMYAAGYDEQLGCTVLEMPFLHNISATFVLPDRGRLRRVEEALRLDTFDRWRKLISRRVVDVSLPRFSITGTYDLKKTLSYLGVSRIFQEHGDLTRIVPNRSLKVGEAMHKAKLKMDERGAEGAAASGIQTLPMERPLPFKLDRAFLLMIAENLTPSMLFLGKIANPTGT